MSFLGRVWVDEQLNENVLHLIYVTNLVTVRRLLGRFKKIIFPLLSLTWHRVLQKHVGKISNISLQLKYCKIFHRNIKILTF